MSEHVLTGFGFGPIQAGLFAKEAFASGNFSRIVAAEIDRRLVQAVRENHGRYRVNVAGPDGIETLEVAGIELLDPTVEADRSALLGALAGSSEIVTSLPSVDFYDAGADRSVAALIAAGLAESRVPATVVYTAENNNRAAETLEKAVADQLGTACGPNVQFLNTVIGKMSRVVSDRTEIDRLGLETIAPGIERAFLVERFNRILVTRTTIPDFSPGIEVFIEKDDLIPFEEAKLYGHNAVHSLLGYIGRLKGCESMAELRADAPLMRAAREAFLDESGAALIAKYADLGEELFTAEGYRRYAEDLLERMTNPYLADTVARAARDVRRKLAPDDRIFGTMRLALEHGIEPANMAAAALAAVAALLDDPGDLHLQPGLAGKDWRHLGTDDLAEILAATWKTVPPDARMLISRTSAARDLLLAMAE